MLDGITIHSTFLLFHIACSFDYMARLYEFI